VITTACYICGSDERSVVAELTGTDTYLNLLGISWSGPRQVVCCERCGLVYKTPTLSEDEIERLYRDVYRNHVYRSRTPDEMFDTIMRIDPAESENGAKLAWLGAALDKFQPGVDRRRLLDIGCGIGVVLALARRMFPDWELIGLEPGAEAAEVAARRTGLPVIPEFYRPGMFERPFHVVSALHVIEHLSDPVGFLSMLAGELTEDGLLFLETPSVGDLATRARDDDRLMSPHLYLFTPVSIANLCHKAGFEVVAAEVITTTRNYRDLRVLCRANPEARNRPLLRESAADIQAIAAQWVPA
jgi:2-polyprenyl-3-methyl-5-hydroxy-6-metoxy-1,4-benzoquinol methylase